MSTALVAGLLVAAAVATGGGRPGAFSRLGSGPPRRRHRRGVRDRIRSAARRDPARTVGAAELAERLAALSRAGLDPRSSWTLLASEAGGAGPAAAVVRMTSLGGTVADGLRQDPDADLRWLAVCWEVSEHSGAPLSQVLDDYARAVRDRSAEDGARRAALAGPRATAQLLGGLPVAALGMGAVLGAHPWEVLATTGPGRVCLGSGATLWLVGRMWTRRLVAAASA